MGDTLTVWAERYLDHLAVERGLSTNTLAAYRRDLRRYVAFCGSATSSRRRTSTSRPSGRSWRRSRRRPGARRSARTARARSHVRSRRCGRSTGSCSAKAEAIGILPPPSCSRSCRVRCRIRSRSTTSRACWRPPTPPPLVGLRDRAILEVLYGAGLRISELVGLDVDDVDLEEGFVRVLGKGGKEREVPLGAFGATP